jgi:hypothetical protein
MLEIKDLQFVKGVVLLRVIFKSREIIFAFL